MSLAHYNTPANLELDLFVQMAFAFIVAKFMLMLAKPFAKPLLALGVVAPLPVVELPAPVAVVAEAPVAVIAEAPVAVVDEVPVEAVEPEVPVAVVTAPVAVVATPVAVVATPVAVVAVAPAPVAVVAPVEIGRMPTFNRHKHHMSKLSEALPFGTKVSMSSRGDKWSAVVTAEGFKMRNVIFKSPNAWGVTFAGRITDAHPRPTSPGFKNSWHAIKVEDGPYAGKTIAMAYDEHFATH